jgi:hypothetical protein
MGVTFLFCLPLLTEDSDHQRPVAGTIFFPLGLLLAEGISIFFSCFRAPNLGTRVHSTCPRMVDGAYALLAPCLAEDLRVS